MEGKTKEQFVERHNALEERQAALQKEFVDLKKAKADKSKIDEVLNHLKEGKEELAALVQESCPLIFNRCFT